MNSNEKYYFSCKDQLCWLVGSLKERYISAGTWDNTAKKVPFNVYQEYALCTPPTGKMIGANENGDPVWLDIPPKTKSELVAEAENKRIELMQNASEIIAPLQDAIDLQIATEEEEQRLVAWKTYRILLNRVDISAAPEIDWPEVPR
ncbi:MULTISPECIES: tail fiber assembly protein [unclassified Arsenophonus]|uniref:tail fiber assembly protein n=1 Tax=unclassified Arsenophonus TaxID=2627083 RepID=UPI00286283FE|nr:tail fiber assembly protein [Arsenophonus sp.]MDR5610609.1 tail fiber assembly protein [Arsenophonus sp.]MDR5614399.1 tail fiber assembly protein [Arsenophonus sp.]